MPKGWLVKASSQSVELSGWGIRLLSSTSRLLRSPKILGLILIIILMIFPTIGELVCYALLLAVVGKLCITRARVIKKRPCTFFHEAQGGGCAALHAPYVARFRRVKTLPLKDWLRQLLLLKARAGRSSFFLLLRSCWRGSLGLPFSSGCASHSLCIMLDDLVIFSTDSSPFSLIPSCRSPGRHLGKTQYAD